VTYRLATDTNGSFENDIIAGTALGELHEAYEGNDFVDAGAGDDVVIAGDGNDVVLGGDGADEIDGGAGNDNLYGGEGDDVILGGDGSDWIETGEGNNSVDAGAGNDWVFSGAGNNLLMGGDGSDVLSGFDGDDTLIGGNGGDSYRFGYDRAGLTSSDHWGHDVVRDNGDAPTESTTGRGDLLSFYGLYGPSSGNVEEAIAKIETARVGDDMVIATMDGLSSVTVENQFQTGTDSYFIENISFYGAYWEAISFRVVSGEHEGLGEGRGWQSELNEFLFGTDGNDMIFSDTGYDLIWTGDGSDTLVYKESDPNPFNEFTYRTVSDTVMDFDITSDSFDFTEIKSANFDSFQIFEDAEGDAIISWYSGDMEIANIFIELRGVAMEDVTEDMFIFAGDPEPEPNPNPAPDPDPVAGGGEDGTLFTGTEGADVMTGTDLADTFVFTADTAFTAVDTIKDYLVEHGDMLDVSDVLVGYDPATNDISEYVVFTSDPESDDIMMEIDADGTGSEFDLQLVAFIADAGELNTQDMLDDGLLLI
jgi:Ca2+-binding RTX toxin-like protein